MLGYKPIANGHVWGSSGHFVRACKADYFCSDPWNQGVCGDNDWVPAGTPAAVLKGRLHGDGRDAGQTLARTAPSPACMMEGVTFW